MYGWKPAFGPNVRAVCRPRCLYLISTNSGLEAWTPIRGTWLVVGTGPSGEGGAGFFTTSSARKRSLTSTTINGNTPIASSLVYPKHPRISSLMLNCTCSLGSSFSIVQADFHLFKCDRRADHGDNVRSEHRISRRQVLADRRTRDGICREDRGSRCISR